MPKKILLGLRNNGHEVNVVTPGGGRPVLGRSHPDEEDARVAILRQWGIRSHDPRAEAPATLDEPLDQRTQTILSHRLEPALRRRLDTGMGAPAHPRRDGREAAAGHHPADGNDGLEV